MMRETLLPSWVALVEIIRQLEEQPYHWPVGRNTLRAVAYAATREGLPTGFVYRRGRFGPFSRDVESTESKLININLLQEKRVGRLFLVESGPNFDRIRRDFQASLNQWASIIEKTTDLFMRVNTERAGVVATVIFAADELKQEKKSSPTETEVLDAVIRWSQRRRPPLDEMVIASTIRNLGMLRWLDVKPDVRLRLPEEESILA
jgi:hypothetical protein